MPTIQFTGAQAGTPTQWYPSDGLGGFTSTLADSLVLDWERTRITQIDIPGTGSQQEISIYHQATADGTGATLAYRMTFAAQELMEVLKWPDDLILQGSWYVLFDSTTNVRDSFHIKFEAA